MLEFVVHEHVVPSVVLPQHPEQYIHGNVSWEFGVFTKGVTVTVPEPSDLLINVWIQETLEHSPQYAPTIDELEVAVYSMFTEFDMKLSPDQEVG